ncbi:LOW QUALITY PROTEIN: Arginine/serine-rich coiled-coil protein 2 [Frankliniella fusca]|uniref:Arginine/serine-rich coiled-coil protein 2 n=1 Tax=Frankliniella fusca TaxID=407009 RepID=A0AAE1HUM5_9NEOP|nr:LOW QUALITY PROTEIN: Arginine/serine-rich coiled-coil protein 2 [Frankliniella fusca]
MGGGIKFSTLTVFLLRFWQNPLNGSKAPYVQAHSLGSPGEAPPNNAINQLESGSESASKDEDGADSPHKSQQSNSSYSPASAASSNESESDEQEEGETSKPEEHTTQPDLGSSERLEQEKCDMTKKESNQNKRDLDHRRDRVKDKDHDKEKEKDRTRDRDRDRGRDRDDRDRRKDYRRDERHRSRSRDRRDRHRSPPRTDRRRDERRKSRERRSSSREHRRALTIIARILIRHRSRSRSRSVERNRPRNESRSSSSSGSSKSDARPKDIKPSSGPARGSRSRSKSTERDRIRASVAESRKFFLDKKIDRKMNVLERMGIELKAEAKPLIGTVTPQMLVQQQEAAQVKQATGIELPSYYNAAAVNPQRLVDQIQKRKLLWGGRKDDANKTVAQPQANKWQGATFAQDQDGKLTAKFNRLMGIKQPVQAAPNPTAKEGGSEIIKKQEEMFHNMESQYEVARLATHTHRGLGLGFGTFQPR